jgi:two-component system CheB/CheR fusion protein
LQMNQLFYNLLGNALKFSKPGVSPVIHISCRVNSHCEIVFQDNGIGIDKKFAEQVFLIFQRLNARERFEGTGIGLALCKKIVLGHGGEIYMTPADGGGTRFHIILPFDQI